LPLINKSGHSGWGTCLLKAYRVNENVSLSRILLHTHVYQTEFVILQTAMKWTQFW